MCTAFSSSFFYGHPLDSPTWFINNGFFRSQLAENSIRIKSVKKAFKWLFKRNIYGSSKAFFNWIEFVYSGFGLQWMVCWGFFLREKWYFLSLVVILITVAVGVWYDFRFLIFFLFLVRVSSFRFSLDANCSCVFNEQSVPCYIHIQLGISTIHVWWIEMNLC